MSTTLEVILKTTGFNEGATAIKKVGEEATATNTKLKTTTSTVDQVSKSTTSLGSKLANAGKQFSGTITNVAALGSTVVNLSRQYQDLTDSQIRVDRTQLKMSRTAEAVTKAQGALNALVSKGVKSGAAYEKALLDVQQAQDASTLAITMNKEALEDQQRTYENFAMTIAPTILTAGSSITSAFKEIGGEKGLGGFATKLQSLPGMSKMSMTSIAASIGLVTAAAGFALVGIQKIFDLMEQKKAIMEGMAKITGGTATPTGIQQEIDRVKKLQTDWATQLADFMKGGTIGKAIFGPTTKEIGDQLIKEWDSLKSRMESQNLMKGLMDTVMGVKADPTMNNEVKNRIIDQIKNILAIFGNKNNWDTTKYGAIEAVRANTVKILTEAMTNLQSDVTLAHVINQVPTGLTGALKDAFLKQNPFAGLMGDTLVAAINATPSTGTDWIGAAKAKFEAQLAAGKSAIFGAGAGTSKGIGFGFEVDADKAQKAFDDIAKASKDAVDKSKADALAFKQAWDAAFSAQVSGIEKSIAAYDRLHPKEKGFSGLAQEKQFADAQKQLDQLMAGYITKSPGYARDFITKFIDGIKQNMTPVAAQVFQPIIDYINTHKNDAPDMWLKGFQEVLGKSNTTLGSAMAGILDKGMVQPAKDAAASTTAALGTINTDSLVAQLQKPKPPADLLTKSLNAIPKKLTPTVTAKTIGISAVNEMTKAIAAVKSKTVTVTVKAGGDVGTLKGFSAGASLHQHGYQSTVKRPTVFIAGEGGRPEDVTVRPRGSVQRGGSSGGGGFYGTVNVYVDGVLRPARYDMGARK